MRPKRSKDDPRRTVMMTARLPWKTLQEACFQAFHQVQTLTRYVIEAVEAHNAKHREMPSKRRPDDVWKP